MWIRFRASDFDLVPKIHVIGAKSNWLPVRRWCSGQSHFCSCDSAVRFLDSENSSQHRPLLLCPAPRRVHFARPWTLASKPTLRLWSGCEEPCRGASRGIFFNKASEPRTSCCSVYSRMIRSHEKDARWVRCSPCCLGPSARPPTASCSLAAVRRRLRSHIVVVFVVQRIDRYSYFSVYLVLLLYQAGSAQLYFYLINRCHFSI